MTLKECYERMQGNYEDALQRLMRDRLIEKFMLKFPADPSMEQLRSAVADQNLADAFRAAHTLKGVAGNLAFSRLEECASNLTEFYRSMDHFEESPLLKEVEESYQLVIASINAYENEK